MTRLVYHCRIFLFFACFFIFSNCGNNSGQEEKDTRDNGTIYISVDESFKPVIDSQIQVYEAAHPDTKIIPLYKPEAACIEDFGVDSIRMVIITRKFSKGEEQFMNDSLKLVPEQMIVARDAVAVIVNPSSPDSLFTLNELRDILKGQGNPVLTNKKTSGKEKVNSTGLIPIFDGNRATSTVRFIIDSLLHGDTLTSRTMAAKNSEGVIDYISKNPNAVGFIGVSWIGNPEDSTQLSFLKKVKMAELESTDIPGSYVLPVQANIYARRYPLIRDLVYILKEKHNGLGHGFAYFLSGETGQLIFRRAYLLPTQKDFRVRPARLNE